jgi:hypothetical protein
MSRSLLSRAIGRMRERKDRRAPRISAPIQGRFADGRAPPPAIFLIGCQRSGTSLLRRIVDSHSRIACPPESKFVLNATGLLRDPTALAGLESMGYGRSDVARSLARFVAAFFEGYAEAHGKARWADKTPNYVDCLEELWELFGPDGRFVLIVRNGLDTAFSLADPHRHYPAIDGHVRRSGGDRPVGAGLFWAEQNSKMAAFRAAHPTACHLVRYEDLTERPEEALRPLFAFLGEPWEPGVIDYARFPHHQGFEDPDVRRRRRIQANAGRAEAWPEEIRRAVREACEPVLSMLGYA